MKEKSTLISKESRVDIPLRDVSVFKYWLDDDLVLSFDYAQRVINYHAKSFSIASRIFPEYKRWATYAVYSFCRYTDNIVDKPRFRGNDYILTELDNLRHELSLAYQYKESEHPVLKSFIYVANIFNIPIEQPMALIDGVQMDLTKKRYENFDELYVFAYRVAGVVGLMMAEVLGYKNPEALKYAEKMGVAMQLTNILRDIHEDKNNDRIYLPLDELKSYGISEEDIINEKFDHKLYSFMKYQVNRAELYYKEAQTGIPMLDGDAKPAVSAAARIYGGILKKIKNAGYNPWSGRQVVPKAEKLFILISELSKHYLTK